MPPRPKFRCPCNCGGMLTAETIRTHLPLLQAQIPNDGRRGNNNGDGDVEQTEYKAMPLEMGTDDHNDEPANMVLPPPPIAPEVNPAYAPAIGGEENGDQEGLGLGMDVDVDLDDQPPPLVPHAVRRNPAVTIEDWPDPFWEPEFESEESDVDDGPIGDFERDPDYIEHMEPPRFDHLDEPELNDQELHELVEAEIGNLASGEWIDMYTRIISKQDNHTLRLLATRLRTHFSRSTYEDLRHGVCETLNIPSECVAWRRLRILSQLETRSYDCCVNSCVCFLGKHKDRQTCPYCGEHRFSPNGKRRRAFRYSPLIPQLLGMFQSPTMAQKMRYRADVEREDQQAKEQVPGDDDGDGDNDNDNDEPTIQDVFDGEHYRTLRETQVDPDRAYRFFDHPEDVALGLSTDGFTLFKRKRRGLSTAWPIILINYNLHPRVRTRLENVICVGVIPGPSQPKDLNSFLIPLLEELLELEHGVQASGLRPDGSGYDFVLHAFLIIIFGDIPAIAKLLMMKGQNAFSPCRACYIEGILCKLTRTSLYYVPLMAPRQTQHWQCHDLPMRTHNYFFAHYDELDNAATQAERAEISRYWGINGEPVFARLKSVDLATIAPYDIMHLLFENLVPNLIKLWTGKFKGLNQGNGSYQLSKAQWDAVGRLTANAARTIPSAFVGTLPDIAQDGNLYKAEAHSFWIQFVAPIVLKGRLPEKYYKHLLLLREVIARCLQMKITAAEVDELEELVQKWVTQYEKYYYQYKQSRLPACPITIHALLHLPYYLRQTGPLWASWAFVMERFCGHLLPAVKNRTRPYDHLDNYVQRRAQMQIVSNVFNLPSLSKPVVNYRMEHGVEISSHETVYPEFPLIVLGRPQLPLKAADLNNSLMAKFTHYFGLTHDIRQVALVRARIDTESIIRHGRFRMANDGDRVRTAKQVQQDSSARDNSYVRYILVPDANAAFRNRPDVPVRQTQYGRLLDIYHVMFKENDGVYTRHLLAHLEPCDTRGLDALTPFSSPVKYTRTLGTKLAHIDTIEAVIGRIELEGGWAIIDPSREALRTRFINEDGNELD